MVASAPSPAGYRPRPGIPRVLPPAAKFSARIGKVCSLLPTGSAPSYPITLFTKVTHALASNTTTRLHADRTARCHCDYCDLDWPLAPRGAESPRGRCSAEMRKQPQTACACVAQLSRRQPAFTRSTWHSHPHSALHRVSWLDVRDSAIHRTEQSRHEHVHEPLVRWLLRDV